MEDRTDGGRAHRTGGRTQRRQGTMKAGHKGGRAQRRQDTNEAGHK